MDELTGKSLSRYRIVSRLGAGGMGVVYRAFDERLGRELALKVLPPGSVADPIARTRFVREAQLASSLNHPNIAHIYEVGEHEGSLFIAMELIEGQPLRELIPAGGMEFGPVISHGIAIADALAHAHERNVIHRDLKSANVMVTRENWIKVLDFGLAKRVEEDTGQLSRTDLTLTSPGMVMGTPNYLPPEIILGGRADARSDVWALGVLLYEMMTGRLPFGGQSVGDLAHAIVHHEPTPLSGRIPGGLRAVIDRCLAKKPEDRYANGKEVRSALEALRGKTSRTPSLVRRLSIPVGILLVVAAAALAMSFGKVGKPKNAPVEQASIGSVAVLPLANLSGDPDQEYFADGMTEALITDLASIRALKVISRTSVMPFKGSKKSLREIAKELDVDGVVEGSVMRAGDRVRITAQLIEGATDRHLWAQSYERDFKDVLALQSEVARDIARGIQLQVSAQEVGRLTNRRPVHPEAYELYLKGRYDWGKLTEQGLRSAIESFEKARALDPKDPRYSAALADAYVVLIQLFEAIPPQEGMPKVKEYARAALENDEDSAEAHTSMAAALFFGEWNWAEAERHIKRAIEINPNYSTARLVYAVILGALGRTDEAVEQDRIAIEVDPLSLLAHWNATATLCSAGRYDEALAQAQRMLQLAPNSPLALTVIVRIHEGSGNLEAALDFMDKLPPEMQAGGLPIRLRQAYEKSGQEGYWRTMLEASMSASPWTAQMRTAVCYAQLKETDRAIENIERAYADHSADMLFINAERLFDPIRGDSRFQDLVRRVGLVPRSGTRAA
jgi:serine/threonine-protein kinase